MTNWDNLFFFKGLCVCAHMCIEVYIGFEMINYTAYVKYFMSELISALANSVLSPTCNKLLFSFLCEWAK